MQIKPQLKPTIVLTTVDRKQTFSPVASLTPPINQQQHNYYCYYLF